MRVHLLKKQSIEEYIAINNQSRIALIRWLSQIKSADWEKPSDMILTFSDADLLGRRSKRIVFNIGGNKYRMVCQYNFGRKEVHLFINWIGAHNEYTRLCSRGDQYKIDNY
ncbi:MAG: type II toxin-antitoxin system HigB family toxin [Bacteroidota bacterium]